MPSKKKRSKAEKKAVKEQQKQEFELKLKQNKLDRELQATRGQISEVRRKVFELAQITKLPIIKESLYHEWGFFERAVDWKDYYISQLKDDLFYYERYHILQEEKHNETIDKISNNFEDGLTSIMNYYSKERRKMLTEKQRQETRLVSTQSRRKDNEETILFRLLEDRKEEMENASNAHENEFQSKLFRYEKSILSLCAEGNEEICNIWTEMNRIFTNYKGATHKKRMEYLALKQQDIIEKNNIKNLVKRITMLEEAKRKYKDKINSLNPDQKLMKELKVKRHLIEFLKEEFRLSLKIDNKKTEKVCLSSYETLNHLKEFLDKITRAITLLVICKKLETVVEKVAPKLFNEQSVAIFEGENVLSYLGDSEKLWIKNTQIKKINKHLTEKLQKLNKENIILTDRLQKILFASRA